MRKIFLTVFLLATFIFGGCGGQANNEPRDESQTEGTSAEASPAPNVNGDLKIAMLNVGQGDAILIQTKKQTILIDTSDTDERDLLVNELEKFSVTKIDKLILTHPHHDHIGNAKVLINPSKKEIAANPYLEKISVAEVYDNGVAVTSPAYKSYMKAVDTKSITHKSLKTGDVLDFGNSVKFKVFSPTPEFVAKVNSEDLKNIERYNINNGSIVGKLTYKKFSMLFTGDAEKETEEEILANNKAKDLKCDVLKGGHHGSSTSSTKAFIAAVNPAYVLISAGPNEKNRNSYGHPHTKTIKAYLSQGINKNNIFCTRWNSTITVTSDGSSFSVKPEKKEDWVDKWVEKKKKDK